MHKSTCIYAHVHESTCMCVCICIPVCGWVCTHALKVRIGHFKDMEKQIWGQESLLIYEGFHTCQSSSGFDHQLYEQDLRQTIAIDLKSHYDMDQSWVMSPW